MFSVDVLTCPHCGGVRRQAISRYIAEQTGVYHVAVADGVQSRLLGDALGRREAEGRAGVRFDFGGIEALVRMIDQEERYWDELFVQAGVAPLELIYEDFVADRLQTLRAVLDHVGVDEAADEFTFEERMAKMSDAVNERLC